MPDNPYAYLRKLAKISQKDFAEKYQFAKTTMTYIESGQYPSLSDDMVLALGRECADKGVSAPDELLVAYGVSNLSEAYKNWQVGERIQAAHTFQNSPSLQSSTTMSPFMSFVLETCQTVQSFCKTLKVPAATTSRYASGATRTMPKAIEDALVQVQFPYLEELKAAQELWSSK